MGDFIAENTSAPASSMIHIPSKLDEKAHLALPYISLWVGVQELIPSRSVYAVYDHSNAGIIYVGGDGILIPADRIIFSTHFKDPKSPRVESYLKYLKKAGAEYQNDLMMENHLNTNKFLNIQSVENELTFVFQKRDMEIGCPALGPLLRVEDGVGHDAVVYQDMLAKPRWNFNPGLSSDISQSELKKLYGEFVRRYTISGHPSLSEESFQHAAFCLVGLIKAKFVSFKSRTSPLTTSAKWIADDFIARFNQHVLQFQASKYIRYPNPILWLEAELDIEPLKVLRGVEKTLTQPWRGQSSGVPIRPILSFEMLLNLKWDGRVHAEFSTYPNPNNVKENAQNPEHRRDIRGERFRIQSGYHTPGPSRTQHNGQDPNDNSGFPSALHNVQDQDRDSGLQFNTSSPRKRPRNGTSINSNTYYPAKNTRLNEHLSNIDASKNDTKDEIEEENEMHHPLSLVRSPSLEFIGERKVARPRNRVSQSSVSMIPGLDRNGDVKMERFEKENEWSEDDDLDDGLGPRSWDAPRRLPKSRGSKKSDRAEFEKMIANSGYPDLFAKSPLGNKNGKGKGPAHRR